MKLTRHLATARHAPWCAAALALVIAGLAGVFMSRPPTLAPDIAYTQLNGTPARTGTLKGQVVLVNFWATNCSACVHEMPLLMAMHRQFQTQGLEILAVAMHYDPPLQVVRFSESRQLPFTVVIDNQGEMARQLGPVELTPTTLLINKRGEIVKRIVGPLQAEALQHALARLLAER